MHCIAKILLPSVTVSLAQIDAHAPVDTLRVVKCYSYSNAISCEITDKAHIIYSIFSQLISWLPIDRRVFLRGREQEGRRRSAFSIIQEDVDHTTHCRNV